LELPGSSLTSRLRRAPVELIPAGRATAPVATRDLAIVVCLGELGLRSEELRRAGSAAPWLQRRTHNSGALTKLQELLGHASGRVVGA